MTEPGDGTPALPPVAVAAAVAPVATDDRQVRRAALRDLAAMIGVEVFY